MDDLPASLVPLAGGWSGETFLADAGGEPSVVRIYGGRSSLRGPLAAETDAALLQLVAPVLPVPRVLEARRGAPDQDAPGLLVCSWVDGKRLEDLLPRLDADRAARVGTALGTLLGRLGLVLQPRSGFFEGPTLGVGEALPDVETWVAEHAERLPLDCRGGLPGLAARAADLLADDRRCVLVHGDLNPKNLLVDPETLQVTALLDWEFAHAGNPWTDLGNLLRHLDDDGPDGPHVTLLRACLASYAALVPDVPPDVLARAEAADLAAVVELAARPDATPPVQRARQRLRAQVRGSDPGWTRSVLGA